MIDRTHFVWLALVAAVACRQEANESIPTEPATALTDRTPQGSPAAQPAPAPPSASVATLDDTPPPKPETCPEGMVRVPAGEARIGSRPGRPPDERPRFTTKVAAFCLDDKEVTVSDYAACVEAEGCTPARSGPVLCTATGTQRGDHPINCVTWNQANAYCTHRGARLPTEIEWEYAASGGDDRRYSWGNEDPDDRTCWKRARTCAVGSYSPGAFGLHDMTGNVWEWTDDWYGEYPWPRAHGRAKVYRGGSWSRRFDKWMRVRLRNRWGPKKKGAHLGMRCAKTLKSAPCPFGRDDASGRCKAGVIEAECSTGRAWNGVRCAKKGESECPAGQSVEPGRGCVGQRVKSPRARGQPPASGKEPATPVTRARSPRFDEDCRTYQPTRPHAYRFSGGSHEGRNIEGRKAGCKNRDVGVGWNSACCP